MPFYTQLRIFQRDGAVARGKKQRVAANLRKLRSALAQHITDSGSTSDSRSSVKIATWNLREFGGSKFGGRDYESIYYIAEVILHFDIAAGGPGRPVRIQAAAANPWT